MSRADETSFGRTMTGTKNVEFYFSESSYETLLAELDNPIWQFGDRKTYVRLYYLTKAIEKIREGDFNE